MKDYTNILRKGHLPHRVRKSVKRQMKEAQRLGLVEGQAYSWYSTSPTVASTDDINSTQTYVIGKKVGTATIIATDLASGAAGSLDFTVSDNSTPVDFTVTVTPAENDDYVTGTESTDTATCTTTATSPVYKWEIYLDGVVNDSVTAKLEGATTSVCSLTNTFTSSHTNCYFQCTVTSGGVSKTGKSTFNLVAPESLE